MYDILKKLNAIEQTPTDTKSNLKESAEAIAEVTPPGREKQVKALKKVPGIDNPYAVSWASYNKSHKKEESIEESNLEEGFADLDKYMQDKEKAKGTGKFDKTVTATGTKYTKKLDPENNDAEDDDEGEKKDKKDKEPNKGGRKVGSKSGARHSYKKIDEYIAEAYGDFFEGGLEEENLEEAQIDAQASNQYGMKIVDALNNQFNNSFSYKVNQDGSFTVVQKDMAGPDDPYNPQYQNNDYILTPQSVSKVINPYYNMFRQKGWRFDQPVGGQFTIAIPAEQMANEDDMEEGNLFTKGLEDDNVKIGDKIPGTNAIKTKDIDTVEEAKSCNQTMEGEECPVHGESKCPMAEAQDNSLEEVKALAGLKECGDMSPMGSIDADQGKMNISTNASSDGTKTVTITADGDTAVALMQMLKLAGMKGAMAAPEQSTDGDTYDVAVAEKEMEEDHIPGHLVGNGTEPQEMPVQALTKGGTGEVAGKEKTMHPHGYKFSDNPLAMENKLGGRFMQEYESIKLARGK